MHHLVVEEYLLKTLKKRFLWILNLKLNEAYRIMYHLVIEEILVKDVNKSDFYGSLSAVLKVNESQACRLRSGQQPVVLKFPASTKPIKMTPAKASLHPETTSLP